MSDHPLLRSASSLLALLLMVTICAAQSGEADSGSGIDWSEPAGGGGINWDRTPAASNGIDWSDPDPDGAAPEPQGGSQGGSDAEAVETARRLQQLRNPLARSRGFPQGLRGEARAFATGQTADGINAALYVPTYYDGGRTWPVLIEGTQRGKLPQVVREMTAQAERQGFIFMAVEYEYFEGRVDRTVDVWTRQGTSSVRITSRPLDEMLSDMVADERRVLELLRTLKRHYTIDDRAVGMTGFLGASLLSYRLPLAYPGLFCASISRSGDFHTDFLPSRMGANARMLPVTIIHGEKEEEVTLKSSQRAAEFFGRRDFRHLAVEQIPNSGVDSRPEIAATCFRAAVERAVGEETATFYRLANQAGLLLGGTWPADSSTGMSTGVAAGQAQRGLAQFVEQYPRSAHSGLARLLMARLRIELLQQHEEARSDLEAFLRAPLFAHDSAPRALIYLVEHFHPPDREPQEALRILTRIRQRKMSESDQLRLAELMEQARRAS